jgi:hypothetical protein
MNRHHGRVSKLERMALPAALPNVIRCSNPKTADELAQIEAHRAAGSRFVLLPHRCDDIDEWLATYTPRPGAHEAFIESEA